MTVAPQAAAGTMSAQSLNQANCRLVDLDTGRFISCLCAHLDLAHRRAVLPTPTRVRLPPARTTVALVLMGLCTAR